jgi:hypothetical protein
MNPIEQALANAIAQAEGVNPTYNNPGALGVGDLGYGTFGQNLTIFPTLETGQAALQSQVQEILSGSSQYYNPDMTIADIGQTYSGGSANWANNVASSLSQQLGTTVTPNTTLSSLMGSQTPSASSSSSSSASSFFGSASGFLNNLFSGVTGGFTLEDGVIIIVGLILIAAGVFSFKTTQTIITVAGKTAAKAAKTSAEVAG